MGVSLLLQGDGTSTEKTCCDMFRDYIILSAMDRVSRWLLVFLFNLSIPLLFGLSAVEGHAVWGLWLTVAGLAIVTSLIVWWLPFIGTAWFWGGVLFAVIQFLPFLHIAIGSMAVSYAKQLEPVQTEYSNLTLLQSGGLATLLTGGLLLICSLCSGIILLLLCTLLHSKYDGINDRRRTTPGR